MARYYPDVIKQLFNLDIKRRVSLPPGMKLVSPSKEKDMNKLTQWIKQLLQAATPTVSSSAWDQYRLARKLSPTAQPIETQRDAVVVNMHRRNRAS